MISFALSLLYPQCPAQGPSGNKYWMDGWTGE